VGAPPLFFLRRFVPRPSLKRECVYPPQATVHCFFFPSIPIARTKVSGHSAAVFLEPVLELILAQPFPPSQRDCFAPGAQYVMGLRPFFFFSKKVVQVSDFRFTFFFVRVEFSLTFHFVPPICAIGGEWCLYLHQALFFFPKSEFSEPH